jgi:hypothetical protein
MPFTKNHKINVGKKYSLERRKKIQLSLIGRKPPQERIERMRISMIGKKHSLESRRKISLSNRGEKSVHWKGGLRSKNRLIRVSFEYKLWRYNVFSRDNFTCQMPGCGIRGGPLEANHIKKFSEFPQLRFEERNGITLCKTCHNKTKWKEKGFENLFTEIINNIYNNENKK